MTLEVGTPGTVPLVPTPGMDLPMPMVKAGCNDNAKLQVEKHGWEVGVHSKLCNLLALSY